MVKVANHYAKDPFILSKAQEFLRAEDPIRAVFNYAYEIAVHKNDNDIQFIKTPLRVIDARETNCVGYATLISSILSAMQIPHYFRAADLDGQGFGHIYIRTQSGLTLDPTIGQAQDDSDTFFNRSPTGEYNVQVPYYEKFDQMPELRLLNGSRRSRSRRAGNILNGLASCKKQCYDQIVDPVGREQCYDDCEQEQIVEDMSDDKPGFIDVIGDFFGSLNIPKLSCADQCDTIFPGDPKAAMDCKIACVGGTAIPTGGTPPAVQTAGAGQAVGIMAVVGLGFALAYPKQKKRRKRR